MIIDDASRVLYPDQYRSGEMSVSEKGILVGGLASLSDRRMGNASLVIVVISCTLTNTDIFPDVLMGASLTVEHVDTKTKYRLEAIKMSQELEIECQSGPRPLRPFGGFCPTKPFTEQVLSRGAEKRINFFFFSYPMFACESCIEKALLGCLPPGQYYLTLEFRKKKMFTRSEIVNMELDISQQTHDYLFWAGPSLHSLPVRLRT